MNLAAASATSGRIEQHRPANQQRLPILPRDRLQLDRQPHRPRQGRTANDHTVIGPADRRTGPPMRQVRERRVPPCRTAHTARTGRPCRRTPQSCSGRQGLGAWPPPGSCRTADGHAPRRRHPDGYAGCRGGSAHSVDGFSGPDQSSRSPGSAMDAIISGCMASYGVAEGRDQHAVAVADADIAGRALVEPRGVHLAACRYDRPPRLDLGQSDASPGCVANGIWRRAPTPTGGGRALAYDEALRRREAAALPGPTATVCRVAEAAS